jgi:Holliday junction resolvase RusA-like endonuclease
VAKQELAQKIQKELESAEYYLSGEVEVEILWQLHERERYQGVHSPDIDNILKPIIDALSGTTGILINDCQVQSVRCSWIDWTNTDQRLIIRIRAEQDNYLRKDGLEWVEIANKLCMPWYSDLPAEFKLKTLKAWKLMFDAYQTMADVDSWDLAKIVTPVVQPFHRARLVGFCVIPLEKAERSLQNDT